MEKSGGSLRRGREFKNNYVFFDYFKSILYEKINTNR